MIDCHCHLADAEFADDLDAVVGRATAAGVRAMLVVTEHRGEFARALQLARVHPGVLLPCLGVHPVQYDGEGDARTWRSVRADDWAGLDDQLGAHHEEVYAVGECGLDLTPRYLKEGARDKEAQYEALRQQIAIAKRYGLPLNCHSRSAGKPVIQCLIENGAQQVLLHAFDGAVKSAAPAIQAGFYFSFPPSSIHSEQKRKLVEKVPLEQILLETDSPVLGPSREERNEPANLTISAEWIAKMKNVSLEEIVKQTTENAIRLFPKLKLVIK